MIPFDVFITSDANWEAKISHAIRCLDVRDYFQSRCYGSSVSAISIVLMCRDPDLNFRQRIAYTKADKVLGFDVMLSLEDFVGVSHSRRREIIAQSLCSETTRIVRKYKFDDFETERFLSDFTSRVNEQLLGDDSSRYDHLCLP